MHVHVYRSQQLCPLLQGLHDKIDEAVASVFQLMTSAFEQIEQLLEQPHDTVPHDTLKQQITQTQATIQHLESIGMDPAVTAAVRSKLRVMEKQEADSLQAMRNAVNMFKTGLREKLQQKHSYLLDAVPFLSE